MGDPHVGPQAFPAAISQCDRSTNDGDPLAPASVPASLEDLASTFDFDDPSSPSFITRDLFDMLYGSPNLATESNSSLNQIPGSSPPPVNQPNVRVCETSDDDVCPELLPPNHNTPPDLPLMPAGSFTSVVPGHVADSDGFCSESV